MEMLTWVDEVIPSLSGDPGDPTIEFYDGDLTKPMLALLKRIANEPDEWTCHVGGCKNAIGYVLHEPEDYHDTGGLRWEWTTVMQRGDKVWAVCEECSPESVYA